MTSLVTAGLIGGTVCIQEEKLKVQIDLNFYKVVV